MTTPKKYNIQGNEIGQAVVSDKLMKAEANGQMIKDYIVALRANARQWSASTKGRSEVKHTTKKPHPQKGGGRSRQGSLVAPQYRGGGRVFAPRPKFDQHVRINKKERRAAIRFLISEKIQNGQLSVVDSLELAEPKTKAVVNFLDKLSIKGRVLFLGESTFAEVPVDADSTAMDMVSVHNDKFHTFVKSMRNIPKTEFSLASNINGYDVILADHIVLTEAAVAELTQWLCKMEG